MTSASALYSQDSSSSTLISDRAKLVTLCETAAQEVEILRPTLLAAFQTLEDAKAALDAEKRRGDITGEQLAIREQEIVKLREAFEAAQAAYWLKEKEVILYKEQLAKTTKKKNFFKNLAKYSTTAALILAGVVVLQNKP